MAKLAKVFALSLFLPGFVLFPRYADSTLGVLALITLIAWALLLILILTAQSWDATRAINSLLRAFWRRVDIASQQLMGDAKEKAVLKAFDKLHREIKFLFETKKIGTTRLKRDVMRFLYPATSQSSHWYPLSLRELGYVLTACDKYSPNAPVLVLHKVSDDEVRNMSVGNTYAPTHP